MVVRQPRQVERVWAYLDGFNIYNGLMAKGWGNFRWLDYYALLSKYMRGSQQLVGVKYFTSLMTHQPDRLARQQEYLQALRVRGDVAIVPGKFGSRPVRCRKCGKSFQTPEEKQSDVNLAVELVADAFDGRFDTFLVCSADSDVVPAVRYVKQRFGKAFFLLDPPRRHCDELAELADHLLHSRKQYFRDAQLPDPVEYPGRKGQVKRIHRPPSWASHKAASSLSEPDDDGVVYCLSCQRALPV
jgi:NYN domain